MAVNRSAVIHSLAWKFMERCSVQLVSFVVTIVLARILCPEDYGLIALVTVFVNLANVIVEGGLNTALIQKKDADQTDFSTIFYTSLGMALFLYLILYLSAGYIANFYNKPELMPVVKVLGFSLFFYAINSVQKAFLSRNLLFKNLFYSSLGAVLFSGVIGIAMAYKGYGVWALVSQSVVSQFATTTIMWFTVKWRPTIEFSVERFKGLFNFGWKIFASNMLINLFINVRSLIIGKVYSASSLAFFDRGKQFPSLIIDNINSSIQSVLFPVLSSEQDNPSSVKAMVRRFIRTSSYIIFPLVFGLATVAEPMVRILLTDKWLGAVPFIRIFCLAYLLMPMQIANLEAIKSLGYSGTTLKIEAIKKIIELMILIITIPMGVKTIAFGIVIYNALCLGINAFPNKRLLDYGIKEQLKDIFPNLVISLAMGGIIYVFNLLNLNSFITLIVDVIIGAAFYFGLSHISKNDTYLYILNMVKNRRNKI